MLKKLLAVIICTMTFSSFAITYQHKNSSLKINLGSNWKLIDTKTNKHITARGYVPSGEQRHYYTKMVAVGKIKKERGREAEQINLFDNHKKKYLLEHNCNIKSIDSADFKHFNAKSFTAFTYQCEKLRISGVDVTLNADDNNSIYNIIYEFRTPTLTPKLDKEAMDALANMKICYDGDKKCQ